MRLRSRAAVFELAIGILITSAAGCGNSFQAGPAGYSDSDDGGAMPDSSVGMTPPDSSVGMTTEDSGGSVEEDAGSTMPIKDSGSDSADVFALDGGSTDPTCDSKEQPSDGVFVSSTVAVSGDGSAALPLKTIAEGLSLAAAAQKATIYLDQGTYAEQVKLTVPHSGMTIQGGFRRVGAAWERDCSNNAALKVVIASPSNVGVTATALTKRAVLRLLSVLSKATGDSIADQGGQSCYGVAVSGDGTALALEDVVIKAGTGGAGGTTTATISGAAATCADGLTLCSDGTSGAAGPAVAKAVDGSFSPDGYVSGNGTPGQPGQPGHNGIAGAAGEVATCYYQGCSGGGALCSLGGLNCGDFGTTSVAAGKGTCGCGGKAGAGGGAGHGGGASIGVYAAAKATVVLTRTQIQTSAGGDGSAPGMGTSGVAGTAGQTGKDASCPSGCSAVAHGLNCNCEQPGTRVLKGGSPSGSGGLGGKGSDGTGGTGGPSFGIVRQGGAIVTRDAVTMIKLGAPGKGSGAADGSSADEQSVP